MKKLYGNPNGKIDTFVIINVNNPVIQFRDMVETKHKEKRKRLEKILSSVTEREKIINELTEHNCQYVKINHFTYLILNVSLSLTKLIAGSVYQKGFIYGRTTNDEFTIDLFETNGHSYPRICYRKKDGIAISDIDLGVQYLLNNNKEYDFENLSFTDFIKNELELYPCPFPQYYEKVLDNNIFTGFDPIISIYRSMFMAYREKPEIPKDKECFAFVTIGKVANYKYQSYRLYNFKNELKKLNIGYRSVTQELFEDRYSLVACNIVYSQDNFEKHILKILQIRDVFLSTNSLVFICKKKDDKYLVNVWEINKENNYELTKTFNEFNLEETLKEYRKFYCNKYKLEFNQNEPITLSPFDMF